MTRTIQVTFDGSVLRPIGRVDLPQGEVIDMTFDVPDAAGEHKGAQSLLEWLRSNPPPPGDAFDDFEAALRELDRPFDRRDPFDPPGGQ